MKKLALIIAFMMILPGAAFGLEMLNDSVMDEITGQSGVSIAFDDIQIFMHIEKMYWQDNDGFGTDEGYGVGWSSTGGQIAIKDFQIDTMRINAITGSNPGAASGVSYFTSTGEQWVDPNSSEEQLGLFYTYDANAALAPDVDLGNYVKVSRQFSGLTIDAAKHLPAISEGYYNNTKVETFIVGGVMIGLPTIEINIPGMQLTPVFYDELDTGANTAVNDYDYSGPISSNVYTAMGAAGYVTATYGTIDMTDITFTVLSGWMEIAPH